MGIQEGSGSLSPLPRYLLSVPVVPALKQADFHLSSGREATIKYDWDDIIFTTLLVRGDDGAEREVLVDSEARVEACCYVPSNASVIVTDLERLPQARQKVVAAAASQARNPRALVGYAPLLGPFVLVAAWLIFRKSRRIAADPSSCS